MARPLRLTNKQKKVMGLILREAGLGRFMSVGELHSDLKPIYECTYGCLRKTLDVLENAGMIVRVRVSLHKEVRPTELGYDWFRPLEG